jgi:hypothetical protein
MQTIKLEIEDSKVDIVLNIIQNLKDNIITKYEIVSEIKEHKDFVNISEKSLEKIWDNQEDSIYDKFLKRNFNHTCDIGMLTIQTRQK